MVILFNPGKWENTTQLLDHHWVDSHIYEDYAVPPYYDSVAQLIKATSYDWRLMSRPGVL